MGSHGELPATVPRGSHLHAAPTDAHVRGCQWDHSLHASWPSFPIPYPSIFIPSIPIPYPSIFICSIPIPPSILIQLCHIPPSYILPSPSLYPQSFHPHPSITIPLPPSLHPHASPFLHQHPFITHPSNFTPSSLPLCHSPIPILIPSPMPSLAPSSRWQPCGSPWLRP